MKATRKGANEMIHDATQTRSDAAAAPWRSSVWGGWALAVAALCLVLGVSGGAPLGAGTLQCPEGTAAQQENIPCAKDGDCEEAYELLWCQRSDGTRHGPSRSWFDHGKRKTPRSAGAYRDGKKDGDWTWWYRNERKRSMGTYKLGARHGAWTIWHDNGRKSETGHYTQDKADGPWTTWHSNGRLADKGRWALGARTGQWTQWDDKGGVVARGEYVANKRQGVWLVALDGEARRKVCYEQGREIDCQADHSKP